MTPRSLALILSLLATILLASCGGARYASQMPSMGEPVSAEQYTDYGVNGYTDARVDNLSTFAIDVDTGSYTITRRKLTEGTLPPTASVRVEEFVNYIDYAYPGPDDDVPFSINVGMAPAPFHDNRHIVRVGIQGKKIAPEARPPAHLTFLVDTSGSMSSSDKLDLVKHALTELVGNLRPGDTVALATYAGSVREILEPTDVADADDIVDAIDDLDAWGMTSMGSGLKLAYELAHEAFQPGHINRVIVCSDGDANVGPTDHGSMVESVRHYVGEGITVSAIGVGMGNYHDTTMEQLANLGDGNYFYFDSEAEAERVFGDEMLGTLMVIAKDVKVQVEFDAAQVSSYRLIGYENRDVADKDFRNDKADGGEVGSGHNVTALYEVLLADTTVAPNPASPLATVAVRYKDRTGGASREVAVPLDLSSSAASFDQAPRSMRVAVAVASFAELLRGSAHLEGVNLNQVRALLQKAAQSEREQEVVGLIDRAIELGGAPTASRQSE